MLFYKIQEEALHVVEKYDLQLIESGMGSMFTYTKVGDGNLVATGVSLTPKAEGSNGGLEAASLKEILIQGNSFDSGKRAFSLSGINAVSQYLLQKQKPTLKEDLRKSLTQFVLEKTNETSNIVFIGHLQPVVKALKENNRKVSVFCRQHTDIENGIYNDIYEYEAISQADILIITGATLLGSTIDAILHFGKNVPIKILSGFSAGAYPKWFQDTGVTHVASIYLETISHSTLLHNNLSAIFTYPCYITSVEN